MISIILPVYNVESYLEDCLSSLLKQNNQNMQVIIVDDGSIDNSKEIAKKYCESYPDIFEYHYKENGGLSDARNFGVQFVRNEYIWFIDSDDYIVDDALCKIENCIINSKPDLIVFDYYTLFLDKTKPHFIMNNKEGLISKKEYLLLPPCAWNKIIKSDLYIKKGVFFPKGIWYEDRATTGNYINFCEKIFYLKQCIYSYRQRDNSIMNQQQYNSKMLDIIKSIEYMHNTLDITYQDELEYITISNLLYQSGMRLLIFHKYKELEECINLCKNRYPKWGKNKYIQNRSLFYQFFCKEIYRKHFKTAYIIMLIYQKIIEKR